MTSGAKWLVLGVLGGAVLGVGVTRVFPARSYDEAAPQILSLPGDADQLIKDRNLNPDDVAAALATYQPSGRHDDFVMFASGGHTSRLPNRSARSVGCDSRALAMNNPGGAFIA
jgi:hypothetical protein